MDESKNIRGWRAEEIAKIFLLRSSYKLSVVKYPTPLFDFFITFKDRPEVRFAVEVKTKINFENNIKRQLTNMRIYRDSGVVDIPVLLFKIDDKEETGELDFLVIPSLIENKLLIRNNFQFEELNQENLNSKIGTIVKWCEKK